MSLPDAALIPARAEGILAKRWAKLAAREGHNGAPPSNETAKRQMARPPKAIALGLHHNARKGAETQAAALDAIGKGYTTVPGIAQETKRSVESIRKAVRNLANRGLIECVGIEKVSGGRANIWRVKA